MNSRVSGIFSLSIKHWDNVKSTHALAGNRTRASRVAGENSTTEPPMLDTLDTCLQTPTSGHTLRSAVLLLDHMFALHSVGLSQKVEHSHVLHQDQQHFFQDALPAQSLTCVKFASLSHIC